MTESGDIGRVFTDNAFYLLAHHSRILSDSRMAMCSLPSMSGLRYFGRLDRVTLGGFLDLWINCSLSRLYSPLVQATTGDSAGKNRSMLKTLIYEINGNVIFGQNCCRAVREDGIYMTCALSSFSDIHSALVESRIKIHRQFQKDQEQEPGTEVFSLQQVIDLLKKEDREQYRDDEEAEENFCLIIDEVFADTRRWLTGYSYYRKKHDDSVDPDLLRTIKDEILNLLKTVPEHLRNSEECCRLTARIDAEKDLGIHGLTNSEAAEVEDSLFYFTSEFLRIVSEMNAGRILRIFEDYREILAKKKNDLDEVSDGIRAARREFRNGTVTQREESDRISELRKIKERLLMDADEFLEIALITILGRRIYEMLNFGNRRVLERFVAEHRNFFSDRQIS